MKRLGYIAIACVLLLLGWVALRPAGPKEPSYQGCRLSEWINDHYESILNPENFPDPAATRKAAKHAIKEMGTNAIPTLLLWAQATNSPMKLRLNALLDRQHHVRFRFKTAGEWMFKAFLGFSVLGNDAMPAVPELVRLLKSADQQQPWTVFECLVVIDDRTKVLLPTFIELLHDPVPKTRRIAANMLNAHYPEEAEKAGVYKMFPYLKHSTTNSVEIN